MNKTLKLIMEILIIVVVIAAGYIGFRTISGVTNKEGVQKEVVITFDAQGYKKDFLEKVSLGDKLIENKKKTFFGEITSVDNVRPYTKVIEDFSKNRFVEADVEDYYSLTFVLTGKAYITDDDIKIGETILKVGDLWPVRSPEYAFQALILKIDIK